MSMLNRLGNGAEVGEMVVSMRDYEAAQKAVSTLIAGEVPARDIAIVGQSVRTIERVTGRLGYAAAARSGAINGVLIGLFLSAIMLFGNPEAPISLFLGFIFIGVALGMIMSLVTYSIVRRRRDFASVTQMAADHYEVYVQPSSLAKARQLLGTARPAPTRAPVDLSEPPRYGERIPQGGVPAPGTQPPAAQPPAAEPPATEPPAAEPPVAEPPAVEHPLAEASGADASAPQAASSAAPALDDASAEDPGAAGAAPSGSSPDGR
ncbi:general stress protein [Microbacterium istanbulense]|uniref:General stress protein n=1 Tax=Microbacterium istanbulense TaxID=3122049 RepID=A0ABU8LIJ1_9MICO